MYICSGSAAGVELRRVEYNNTLTVSDPVQLVPNARCFCFSPNYSHVAFFTRTQVQSTEFPDKFVQVCRFDVASGTFEPIQQIPAPNIFSIKFSPRGTFIMLLIGRTMQTDEAHIPLVQIWRVGGEMVRSFSYGKMMPEIFWSNDEKVFASTHQSGIFFYQTNPDGSETEIKVELEKLIAADFVDSKQNGIRFAVVYSDQPRKMKIFGYPDTTKQIAFRPVMVGEKFEVKISPAGTSAIAIGSKNESGETYMGDSYPYYVNDQNFQRMNIRKSGPIHSIDYYPTGGKYIAIGGHVPPSVTLIHEREGTAVELGQWPVNSVRYSGHPNIAAIGGFGNFPGDIKVVDLIHRSVIAEGVAKYSSEWGWSPCGRLLFTGVMLPKMRVSNEINIYSHVCERIWNQPMTEMTQCEWVGLPNLQPLPKLSPPPKKEETKAAYVPPHLRKKADGSAPAPSTPSAPFPPGFGSKGRGGRK